MVMRQRVRIGDITVQPNVREVSFLSGPGMKMTAGPSSVTLTLEFDATDPKLGEKLAKLMEDQKQGYDLMMELSTIRAEKPRSAMPPQDFFTGKTAEYPHIDPVPPTEFDYSLAPRPATPKAAPSADIPTTPPPEGTW